TGDLSAARRWLERIATTESRALASQLQLDAADAASLVVYAHVLLILGLPDQSIAILRAALDEAEMSGQPFLIAMTLANACIAHCLHCNVAAVGTTAARLLDLSQAKGLPAWSAVARIFHGWYEAMRGRTGPGLTLLRKGVSAWQAIGYGVETTL